MIAKDKRSRFMNELLNGIKVMKSSLKSLWKLSTWTIILFDSKVVKLYAWENAFLKVVSKYRLKEIILYILFYQFYALGMQIDR